jgi:peroxiredoxin
MSMYRRLAFWQRRFWLAVMVLSCLAGAVTQSVADDAVGRKITDFVLPDPQGKPVALSDFPDAKVRVVVFLGTECPIGNAYIPDLIDFQKRYRDQSVQVVGVNAMLSDTAESIQKHITEYKIDFPVLVDAGQTVADLFGVVRIPTVFVLDRRGHVHYVGRFDDRVGFGFQRDSARRSDVEEAVKEVLAGNKVSVAQTQVDGCKITRKPRLAKDHSPSFSKDVARILHTRCAGCHHADTAAPFSLLTFQDAKQRTEMIREVVADRRMPPWDADPRFGKFENDLRLPQHELDTLLKWIDEGAEPGDDKDLPEPPKFTPGWQIGQPDIVFQMQEEFAVPATGTVQYKYFVVPTNLDHDIWVQAAEPRPGNRAVVHHIIVYMRKAGSKKQTGLPAIGGFAVGEEPVIMPRGTGIRIPKGYELVFQMHYTPNGKETTDRSEMGIVLCPEPPEREVHGGAAMNLLFRIPPGAARHEVTSSTKVDKDMELLTLMPHMHVRGRDFKFTARYPDGRTEVLLNVPNYDFQWQHRYRLAEPKRIPAGTRIDCVAHFDNSTENPGNPDATKGVTWGDQTWEEMMIGFFTYVDPLPVKKPEAAAESNSSE